MRAREQETCSQHTAQQGLRQVMAQEEGQLLQSREFSAQARSPWGLLPGMGGELSGSHTLAVRGQALWSGGVSRGPQLGSAPTASRGRREDTCGRLSWNACLLLGGNGSETRCGEGLHCY